MGCTFLYTSSMKKVRIKGFPVIDGQVKDGAIIDLPIPSVLNDLALSGDGDDWDLMCKRLPSYGFMNPIGKMAISHISIDNGKNWRVFH